MFYLLIFIVIGIAIIAFVRKNPFTITSHWQTFLDEFQLSALEFYTAVTAGLKERQITQVAITEETFIEKHVFSAKRVYLRITQDEYVFFINCSPYGTGTFISSWLCIKDENIWNRIPILNKLIGKDRKSKTFYQMDTEAMFRLAVHNTVLAVVDGTTNAKGYRGLTEFERRPILNA